MEQRYSEKVPPIIFADDFEEHHKICWRVEQAVPDPKNPLLSGKYPWDLGGPVLGGSGTILKDPIDGKYKGWVTSWASDVPEVLGEEEYIVCYIESEDGVNWERPMLDMWPRPGYPKTNILLDFPAGGRGNQPSVFIDPEKNPDEPYEMFCYREPMFKCPSMVVEGMNQTHHCDISKVVPDGPYYGPGWKYYGIYRHKSKDGIHWRPVEGPLFETGDSCSVFKDASGGYVAHSKVGVPLSPGNGTPYDCYPRGCRQMFLRTSPDGTNWSERKLLMAPDWQDYNGDQIMQLDRIPYGDGFLGLTAIIHTVPQQIDLQWSASQDGTEYWRPIPRNACIPNGPVGDHGGGMIWPVQSCFEIDGRLYAYYGATRGLHCDIYSQTPNLHFFQGGALCRASWEMGRFYAAVNSRGGGLPYAYLTSKPSRIIGKHLMLNAATVEDGEIRVELLDGEKRPIPDFAKEDCEPFKGDDKFAVVKWKGGNVPAQDTVGIRFYISSAMLYGYVWA